MANRYPGMFEKRGSGYRYAVNVAGKLHRLGPRDYPELRGEMSENERIEFATRHFKRLQKDAERHADGLPGPMPFSKLLDAYEADQLPRLAENTRKTYINSIDRFRSYFVDQLGDPRVDRIRAPHVRRFLAWREKTDEVGARTLQKDRATLHAIFRYATKDLEVVDANPVANVKPPKVDGRDPVILNDDQYEALLAACERDEHGHKLALAPMLKLYVLTLAETGARCESEALWLQWEDIDHEGGFLWIASGRDGHRTKSGKGRWVPMTPRLRQAMREHALRFRGALYNGQTSPWVFHHPYTRRRAKAGQRIGSLRRGVLAAAKRAKLPADFHLHDLRHRRATTWIAEGANPVHVKEALGHADLRTTMGYTHLAREHLRSLVSDEEREAVAAEMGR